MVEESTPSGWYKDPTGQGDGRYWSGTAWTTSVNRGGVVVDVPIDEALAVQPPFPGSQVRQPSAPIVQPAPIAPTPAPVVVQSPSDSHSGLGAILAILAIVFFAILMIVAISSSSDDNPEEPTETPTEEPQPEPADG